MGTSWIGAGGGSFARGRRGLRPQLIVLHRLDGDLGGADALVHDPAAGVSTHYGVGPGGEVHHYVQEPDTAFHADPLLNRRSIGVCHVGGARLSPAQTDASHRLVIAIARRWGIPLDGEHVVARCADPAEHGAYLAGLLAMAAGRPGGVAPGLPVRLRARARVRREPHTEAPVLRVLSRGATFLAASSVSDGERVEGNPVWHRSPDGEFLWSGATDRPRAV